MKFKYFLISFLILIILGYNNKLSAQVNCDSIVKYIPVETFSYTQSNPELFNFNTSFVPQPGFKAIYWIHGMNGGASFWEKPSDWSDLYYKTFSSVPSYGSSQDSWLNSWSDLGDEILDDWLGSPSHNPSTKSQVTLYDKSFSIAESFGGLVIRKISEQLDPEPINGIVTFDTPHGGSNLAQFVEPGYDSNITTPEFEDLANTFANNVSQLSGGPITEYLYFGSITYDEEVLSIEDIEFDMFGIDFATITSDVQDVIDNLWSAPALFELVFDTPISTLVSITVHLLKEQITRTFIQAMTSEAVQVLSPSSSVLNINEQITPEGDEYKRVAFYGDITTGNEDAHFSAFKMLYSTLNSPHTMTEFSSGDLNGEAEDLFFDIRDYFEAKELQYEELYDGKFYICPIDWPWSFNPYITWGQLDNLANLYSKGFEGFINLNDYYETLCGARENDQNSTLLGTCVCKDYYDNPVSIQENIPESSCTGQLCDWYPNEIEEILRPYDGFLTAESMKAWNTVTRIPKVPLVGSNHVTVKNDLNTKIALEELFNGAYGNFFKTDFQ